MATERSCDYGSCDATDATAVIVSAALSDVVEEGTVTGHEERADACPAHRDAMRRALMDAAWETLVAQVPFHVELAAATRKRDDALAELRELEPTILALDGKAADRLSEADRKAIREHNAAREAYERARDERRGIAERGTKVADERREKLSRALKAGAPKTSKR